MLFQPEPKSHADSRVPEKKLSQQIDKSKAKKVRNKTEKHRLFKKARAIENLQNRNCRKVIAKHYGLETGNEVIRRCLQTKETTQTMVSICQILLA